MADRRGHRAGPAGDHSRLPRPADHGGHREQEGTQTEGRSELVPGSTLRFMVTSVLSLPAIKVNLKQFRRVHVDQHIGS